MQRCGRSLGSQSDLPMTASERSRAVLGTGCAATGHVSFCAPVAMRTPSRTTRQGSATRRTRAAGALLAARTIGCDVVCARTCEFAEATKEGRALEGVRVGLSQALFSLSSSLDVIGRPPLGFGFYLFLSIVFILSLAISRQPRPFFLSFSSSLPSRSRTRLSTTATPRHGSPAAAGPSDARRVPKFRAPIRHVSGTAE